jgi:hypothetical protein
LGELVRGADPVPAGASDPAPGWAERVDRRPLMVSLEQAQQERLGPWTAAAGQFRGNRQALKSESELLAAIAEIIQRDGYEFADDEGYRSHARKLQSEAIELRRAIDEEDFEKARTATSAINQSCDQCHADYRN